MKKNYLCPFANMIEFTACDVITSSSTDGIMKSATYLEIGGNADVVQY